MNKVILIGRLTAKPELSNNESGKEVCGFTLAVNRNYKNKEGKYDADFIHCVAFRNQAVNLTKYCDKGSPILVEGPIQVSKYEDENGNKKTSTKVIVNQLEFLESKKEGSMKPEENVSSEEKTTDPFVDFGQEVALSDEDLPF